MTVTLIDTALVAIEDARLYVLRDATNATQDDLLATLINQTSTAILRLCARQFFEDNEATYLFEYDGSGYLDLAPYELRTLTSISVTPAGATDPLVLDPTVPEYSLMPMNKSDEGTYMWLRMIQVANPRAFPDRMGTGLMSTVSITGDWGMAEIPWDVREACLVTVKERKANPAASQQVNIGDLHLTAFPMGRGGVPPLPPAAMALLENVRRSEVGV